MTEQEKKTENAELQNNQETEQNAAQEASQLEEVHLDDPLEEAIARVQELQQELAVQQEEGAKREQEITLRARAEMENIRSGFLYLSDIPIN